MAVHRNPSDRNVFYLGKTEPEKTFRFIGLKYVTIRRIPVNSHVIGLARRTAQ